ncbi:WD40-repeat-containing domain protein [Limtongia smithiae]|uniref:WD40-repeat-containing domain protein n=1 Tax=Limtongia smithiae TaxID=1125753 RepID=UPI0034CDDF9E
MALPAPSTAEQDAPSGKIRITLSTRDESVAVPDLPIFVPLALRRYGLSEIVNHLLASEKPIPFDFLAGGELLRVSLLDYITSKGLSAENTLALEYTRSILPPTFLASYLHPDWVSSVDILRGPSASPLHRAPLLAGSFDGIVRTWSLSGDVVLELAGHSAPVKTVKWLDARRAISGSMDRSIRIWRLPASLTGDNAEIDSTEATMLNADTQTVTAARVFTGHKSTVDDLAVNIATSRMLSAGADGVVGLWTTNYKEAPPAPTPPIPTNVAKRRKRSVLQESRGPLFLMSSHLGPVTGVIFDAKDSTVGYSVSLDHTIKTWDLVSAQLVDTRTTSFPLLAIAHLPALSLLCCGSSARHITLHDPRTASTATTTQQTLVGHTNFVSDLVPSPDSDYMFASSSYDGTVRVWDVRAQRAVYIIEREEKSPGAREKPKVFGVDWEKYVGIVSAGEDKQLQINRGADWDQQD